MDPKRAWSNLGGWGRRVECRPARNQMVVPSVKNSWVMFTKRLYLSICLGFYVAQGEQNHSHQQAPPGQNEQKTRFWQQDTHPITWNSEFCPWIQHVEQNTLNKTRWTSKIWFCFACCVPRSYTQFFFGHATAPTKKNNIYLSYHCRQKVIRTDTHAYREHIANYNVFGERGARRTAHIFTRKTVGFRYSSWTRVCFAYKKSGVTPRLAVIFCKIRAESTGTPLQMSISRTLHICA